MVRVTVGILCQGCHLGKDIQSGKGTQAVVKVQIGNVRKSFFADKLEGHKTHEVVDRWDLFGAIETTVRQDLVQVQLHHEGKKEKDTTKGRSNRPMRAEGAHIGHLCWDFGSLQSLSSFGSGSAKEPDEAFDLQEEVDRFRADRLAFPQKDLLNLADGVVLFPESNDALLALGGGGPRGLRTSCEREKERLERASLEISAQGGHGV